MLARLHVKTKWWRRAAELFLITGGSVVTTASLHLGILAMIIGQLMVVGGFALQARRSWWIMEQYKQLAEKSIADALENGVRANKSLFDVLRK